jgi:hypothetical protein
LRDPSYSRACDVTLQSPRTRRQSGLARRVIVVFVFCFDGTFADRDATGSSLGASSSSFVTGLI